MKFPHAIYSESEIVATLKSQRAASDLFLYLRTETGILPIHPLALEQTPPIPIGRSKSNLLLIQPSRTSAASISGKVYDLEDRYPGRKFAFSHLYTALTRHGYREYLGLPDEWRDADPQPNPVPAANLDYLKRAMVRLYGSNADDIEPVTVSQNPHVKHLGAVLQNSRARSVMMMRTDLRVAYAQVESKSDRFEESLINAKQEAENAMSQITGYDPAGTTLLEMGEELNKTSELLYSNMVSMAKEAGTIKARK